jgi:hypothetical protein
LKQAILGSDAMPNSCYKSAGMIRRDFVHRTIQKMSQSLASVLQLKEHQEYEQALREIGRALREFGEGDEAPDHRRSLDDWLVLCRKHPESAGGVMLAVGDVLREQSEIFSLQDKPTEALYARQMAAGIFIEAMLREECFVSGDLVSKVERLVEQCSASPMPPELLSRLVTYFEVRGDFAKAEDTLFEWLETGDPDAASEGRTFYERLAAMSDDTLAQGGLTRAEIEQGGRDWEKALQRRT